MSFPAEVDKLVMHANIIPDPHSETGHYQRQTKAIHLGPDPSKWNGRPGLLSHEMGHHIHFETNTVTHYSVHPDFEIAMKSDLKRLKTLEKTNPGMFNPYACTSYIEQQYGKTLAEKRTEIGSFADTLGGLTKGKWGWGHKKSYYAKFNMWAMEVYANAFEAISQGDKIYQQWFPEVTKAVRQSFNRAK